jgi:hypothetical protein
VPKKTLIRRTKFNKQKRFSIDLQPLKKQFDIHLHNYTGHGGVAHGAAVAYAAGGRRRWAKKATKKHRTPARRV